jgi:hypothetical protein
MKCHESRIKIKPILNISSEKERKRGKEGRKEAERKREGERERERERERENPTQLVERDLWTESLAQGASNLPSLVLQQTWEWNQME